MENRLKRNKDFQFLFNRGSRSQTPNLIVIYHKSRGFKVGYSVSKKHGKSVVRNRIKRLLRESFRSFAPLFRENFFFVFIPKVKEDYTLKSFKESMNYLFKKGGFID